MRRGLPAQAHTSGADHVEAFFGSALQLLPTISVQELADFRLALWQQKWPVPRVSANEEEVRTFFDLFFVFFGKKYIFCMFFSSGFCSFFAMVCVVVVLCCQLPTTAKMLYTPHL